MKRTFAGLILIDLPFLITIAVVGSNYGYRNTYTVFSDWRLQHPWSFAPAVLLIVVLIQRRKRSGK